MEFEKFRYKILPEKKLIIKCYRGSFSIPDFIRTLEETGKDSLYNPDYNVINDFRDATSAIKIGEINKIFGHIKGHKVLYGKRKSVLLVKTSNKNVFTMIRGLLKREKLIGFKIYETMTEALTWIDIPISDLDTINSTIQELKDGSYKLSPGEKPGN
jgi:hypothetical protein